MNDPRAVANYVLDEAVRQKVIITNLALQKLIYFAHAISLVERKESLVAGYFEAWRYGPVHPVVNDAFKSIGAKPILFRAKAFDPVRRIERELLPINDLDEIRICNRVVMSLGKLGVGRLVELTHARGGPWDHVVASAKTSPNLGLRIPNSVIAERHANLKVVIGNSPKPGEPHEDSPFA